MQNHFFVKNQPAYVETCGTFCRYDPARARALLRAAGWTMRAGVFAKNGRPLTLTVTIAAGVAEAAWEVRTAQGSLRNVGVELRVQTTASAVTCSQVTAVNADIVNLGAAGFGDLVYQDVGYRR